MNNRETEKSSTTESHALHAKFLSNVNLITQSRYESRFLISESEMLQKVGDGNAAEAEAYKQKLASIPAMNFEKDASEVNMNMRLFYDKQEKKLVYISLKDILEYQVGQQPKMKDLPRENKENNFLILKVNIEGKIYYELRVSPLGHLKNLKKGATLPAGNGLFVDTGLHQGTDNVVAGGEFYTCNNNIVFLYNLKTGGLHKTLTDRLGSTANLQKELISVFVDKLSSSNYKNAFYDYGSADKDNANLLSNEVSKRLVEIKRSSQEVEPTPPQFKA